MKSKDLLLFFVTALIITFALQWWFSPHQTEGTGELQAGQRFRAPSPQEAQACKPLNLEIDFAEDVSKEKPILTTIDTDSARYVFSTEGASLQLLEFRRNWAGKDGYLATVFPPAYIDRDRRCFLVAFPERSPYNFTLVSTTETEDFHIIHYQASLGKGILQKVFTVFKDKYQIDVEISVTGTQEEPFSSPRLFFSSPLVPELGTKDATSALVGDANGKIHVESKSSSLLDSYWIQPSMIGTQDRYFMHVMVADQTSPAQRAYFKSVDLDSLYTILEGPASLQQPWKLSFYFGPKEYDAVMAVDKRLVQALNYGWFAFISRPVSHILMEILNRIYTYCKNYGVAIIILVLLMRLLLMPFAFSAERGNKERMELQKKMKHVEEKYKHDKEALLKAKHELIKKHGLPGFGGLLTMLLQIPLFIALGWVLSNSIQLYMAPFLWIPDLSSPDPYYILPIMMVLSMIMQAVQADPSQRMSFLIAALFIGAFFVNVSAGLALYFLVSTLAGIGQTMLVRWLKRA
jgi:YidC/Oxa1 family membrane protein insertase